MKFSAQEEYGLRCILQLARTDGSVTISQLAVLENLTTAYVGKLMRILRQSELVVSVRGQAGGYYLAKKPEETSVGEVLSALGGTLFCEAFCNRFSGAGSCCIHAHDCSIRALWSVLDELMEGVLNRCTLAEMVSPESTMRGRLNELVRDVSERVAVH